MANVNDGDRFKCANGFGLVLGTAGYALLFKEEDCPEGKKVYKGIVPVDAEITDSIPPNISLAMDAVETVLS